MDPIPFRIRIGITGHRSNLPESELLKSKIREVLGIDNWSLNKTAGQNTVFSFFDTKSLAQLREARNTPIGFSIVTALAEGADRIAAKSILDITAPVESLIEAVLPLVKEEYLLDFETNQSKQEFNALLRQDPNPVFLRNRTLIEQYPTSEIDKRRTLAYYNAGKFVVDRCDLLLAVWDGIITNRKGGTWEVVEYAKEQKRPLIIISSKDIQDITLIPGHGLNASVIDQLDFMNTYTLAPEVEKSYVENIYADHFTQTESTPESVIFNSSITSFIKERLFPYYAKASMIAKKYQREYKNSGVLAYWLSSLAVITLIISVVFGVMPTLAFVIELVLLITILIIITRAHRCRAHTRWLEHRFLAERIRVTPYFFIPGYKISELKIAPYRDVRKESGQWMIYAFSELWNMAHRDWYRKNDLNSVFQPFSMEYIQFVNKSWIQDQLAYHKGKLKSKNWYRRSSKWWNSFLEHGSRLIFFAALLCATAHIVVHKSGSTELHWIEQWLTFFSLSLPVVAAAFEGVRRQREYSRNTKRSAWMADALKVLSDKYDRLIREAEDLEDVEGKFQALLLETDQLMLHETQDWMMLMVESNLEYVT